MKLKIALDTNVGKKRYEEFIGLGYDIVVVAEQAEKDCDWVARAHKAGARFLISNDVDIPKLIERTGYPMFWVNYPNDNPQFKEWLVEYCDQVIKFKLNVFKNVLKEAT